VRRRSWLRRSAACLPFAFFLHANAASASGLFVTDRGVRPLARGGAFVAGADDLHAIWYNPAGLADAGTSVLLDFAYVNYGSEYTRRTRVADASGALQVQTFPTVTGEAPFLPIPTVAGSYTFDDAHTWTVALGVHTPYAALAGYPLTLNGQPAPSRYSIVSPEGSALLIAGGYVAYKPIEQIRLGAGIEALLGTFQSTVMFSASPQDRLVGAPEDPERDSLSRLKVGPIFAPSANVGVTVIPEEHIHVGASLQLPFVVNAPATVDVRLPRSPEFEHASQAGNEAHVRFQLPTVFRVGAEFRQPLKALGDIRMELAFVREFWTQHHSIDVQPDNLTLVGITGFPSPFAVAPISIPRRFDNANSYRLGAEYTTPPRGENAVAWVARLGVSYDESAVPVEAVSPASLDSDKVIVSLGAGVHVGRHWRFDAMFAHVFFASVEVDPAEAGLPRVNPIKANPTQGEAINGGSYSAHANIAGLGAKYAF
jgi:long-chain fatty acid transport protein